MERSSAGEGARAPLRKRPETERTAVGAKSQPRGFLRAALAVCFLLVPAVLLLLRWQAGPAPEWVFAADLRPEVNRGTIHVCGMTFCVCPSM
jgi:xyloglucan fucosyltransferase